MHPDNILATTTFGPIEKVLSDRGKTHGDYSDHARVTQILKDEMRKSPNWNTLGTPFKESLDMIAHKIGRILAGDPDFKDHWVDIAGYAQLSGNRCSK